MSFKKIKKNIQLSLIFSLKKLQHKNSEYSDLKIITNLPPGQR